MNQFTMIMGLVNIAVDLVGKVQEMKAIAERNKELSDEESKELDEKIENITKSIHWQKREPS